MRTVPTAIATKLPRAARLIAERGLDQVKIEELADATGIPKATLYYYFAGKEEMLGFLLGDALTALGDAVTVAVDAPGTAHDRLGEVIRAQLRFMADQPEICRALFSELGRAGRIPDIADALSRAYYAPVERLLTEGAADGSLRAVADPATTAVAIFGAVTISGLAQLVAAGTLDPDELGGHILDLVLTGVGPEEQHG